MDHPPVWHRPGRKRLWGTEGVVSATHTFFPAGEAGEAGKLDLNRFISTLSITQGEGAGEPLRLFHWQRRFLRGAMKPDVSTAALTVSRGAGRRSSRRQSRLRPWTVPLVQNRAEIVLVASSFGQARILFEHCLALMEKGHYSGWRGQARALEDSGQRELGDHRGPENRRSYSLSRFGPQEGTWIGTSFCDLRRNLRNGNPPRARK